MRAHRIERLGTRFRLGHDIELGVVPAKVHKASARGRFVTDNQWACKTT